VRTQADRRSRPARSPRRVVWMPVALALVVPVSILVLGSCSRDGGADAPARHVVVISIDTARADHFGFLGSEVVRTPRLDAFAEESIVFTDCMTVVPTTLASHVTLLTGKYPHHHGTPRNGFMVSLENEMLPEILAGAGFRTAGFAGSFSLDSRFDFAQGFAHYDEDFDILVGNEGADQNQRRASEVTDAVIRYLDDAGVPDRLFLFVHYFDPHRPYDAPEPFASEYDTLGIAELPPIRVLKRREGMSDEEIERYALCYELRYRAEIAYTDHEIGRLFDDLRARGVLNEALVIVTSDHGESLWEHGEEFDHGYGVYDSTMRAVCAMRLPDGEWGGAQVNGLVASIDVLPTILGFLGIPTPGGVDGEAVPLADLGAGFPERTRFGQATKPRKGLEDDPRWTNIVKAGCIRSGRFKLIETPYRRSVELYDLAADPHENDDLVPGADPVYGPVVSGLRAELRNWTTSADPLPSSFESSQRDETIERLRSLGYVN